MVRIKKKHTGIEKNKFILSEYQESEKQKKKKKHAP
tara:strand:+ start:1134 stop:1241 length:108 start_codon:yes stop_codon:yes gene_type:complete